MESTSASLLGRLRQDRSDRDWDRFVQLYTPLLFAWARRLRLGNADAADLVQDVFLTLVRVLPEFRHDPERSFRAWLRTVFHNRWRDLQARPTTQPLTDEGVPLDDWLDDDPAHAVAEAEYRQHLVERALELMRIDFSLATWQAFWECTVERRPAAEVAAELHLTVGAVYHAKARVLARLRQELGDFLH